MRLLKRGDWELVVIEISPHQKSRNWMTQEDICTVANPPTCVTNELSDGQTEGGSEERSVEKNKRRS